MEQIPQSHLAEPQLDFSSHRVGLEKPGNLGRVQNTANTADPGDAKAPQSFSLPADPHLELDPQVALLALLEGRGSPLVDHLMTQGTMTTMTTQH